MTACHLKISVEKKQKLEAQIKRDHPKIQIYYNEVHKKCSAYFDAFSKIYNGKCAYCGSAIQFTGLDSFEVDHFMCENKFDNSLQGRIEAGKLENLIFSCYTCNRGKGNLLISDHYCKALNPDDSSIAKVFCRDRSYYIRLQDNYAKDEATQKFYNSLKLGFQIRRIDYLLQKMEHLKQKVKNKANQDKLGHAIAQLMKKKNSML